MSYVEYEILQYAFFLDLNGPLKRKNGDVFDTLYEYYVRIVGLSFLYDCAAIQKPNVQ